ncbi:hypothetical protein [Priestia abyssalis]|uniref:hypothetical protein n=1 Tax=Priestia abyssalis TaxID=1221450 RepID=UPI00099552D2|nr:hypothetical protein [Priestia abyssalis]
MGIKETHLWVNDYLDLYLYAGSIGDTSWQQKILEKLQDSYNKTDDVLMIKRDLPTYGWLDNEIVVSPSYGTIEEIFIEPNHRIYEWEPLFIIKTENGTLEQLAVGISGIINTINVKKGDSVLPGTVLVHIKADHFIVGNNY